MMLQRWMLACVGWLAVGCSNDGSSDSVGDAESVGEVSSATSGTSGADGAQETNALSTGGGAGESTGSMTSGGGVQACGEFTCIADQICLVPCCGGPAPTCYPVATDGSCLDGADPVPAAQCTGGCDSETCCPPMQCVPDPPRCVALSEVTCDGTFCSGPSCQGMLEPDGSLACQCA